MPRSALEQAKPAPGIQDAGVWELLALPIVMGGISLLLWTSIPTFQEALDSLGGRIDARREQIFEMAAGIGSEELRPGTGCSDRLEPLPVYVEDDPGWTNTAILGGDDLQELGAKTTLGADLDLYLRSELGFILYWRLHPPTVSRRMTKKRIAREFERPIDARYLVLYGVSSVETIEPGAAGPVGGGVSVNAYLFDFASGRRLCDIAFVDGADSRQTGDRLLSELSKATGGQFERRR